MKRIFTILPILFVWVSLTGQRLENTNFVDGGNYKAVEPVGYGDAHYVEQNKDLIYTIHFQNNGSDTAYNLRIIDTLSYHLNVTSIREEGASHPFSMTLVEDNIVRFSFPNIRLPNRVTNEAASMGFVSFKVSQKENLPLNTVIRNRAASYFDFLPPVFTNEVFNTIGENFTNTDWVFNEDILVEIAPNPISEMATINVNGMAFKKGKMEVFSANGQLLQLISFRHPRFDFFPNGLPSGQLFYKISLDGQMAATGVLIIR